MYRNGNKFNVDMVFDRRIKHSYQPQITRYIVRKTRFFILFPYRPSTGKIPCTYARTKKKVEACPAWLKQEILFHHLKKSHSNIQIYRFHIQNRIVYLFTR